MESFDRIYHYQAGGKQMTLRPDEGYFGIDASQLGDMRLSDLEKRLGGPCQRVSDKLLIVAREQVDDELLKELQGLNALLPVFEDSGTQIVVMPEVRVEEKAPPSSSPAGLEHFGKWLDDHGDEVQVVAQKPGRFTLAPVSGYGPDAAALADRIATEFHSLSASPRLLRVVPKLASSS